MTWLDHNSEEEVACLAWVVHIQQEIACKDDHKVAAFEDKSAAVQLERLVV